MAKHFPRFFLSTKKDVENLRKLVTAIELWKTQMGLPTQNLAPVAHRILKTEFNAANWRLLETIKGKAWKNLARRPEYALIRRQDRELKMECFEPEAYHALMLRREVDALRKEQVELRKLATA